MVFRTGPSLGTIGIELIVGPIGLVSIKLKTDPNPVDLKRLGMDYAFLALLFFTSVTGMALLFLRETPAMGILLAVHLGVVLALFLTLPYGKFVHGVYRMLALIRDASERRREALTAKPRTNRAQLRDVRYLGDRSHRANRSHRPA